MTVKKLTIFKTSLCALLGLGICVSSAGAYTANAEEATVYPESFTKYVRNDLQAPVDYAVGGGEYAFADQSKIKIYGKDYGIMYDAQQELSALDYSDGSFYYAVGSEWFCLEKDENGNYAAEQSDYAYTQQSTVVLNDGSLYRLLSGKLYYYENNSKDAQEVTGSDNDYSKLKMYGNTVYALSGQALYKINASTASNVSDGLTYIKFETETIAFGSALSTIKSFNLDELHFVTLKEGYYITKLDLNELNGKYFKTDATYRIGDKNAPKAETTALLLCSTGNASVIMIDRNEYILLSEAVTQLREETLLKSQFNSATVSINDYAYSSPHRCEATKLFELNAGNVKILGKVSLLDFYKIQYVNSEGETLTGYVPSSYVSQFTYIESEPNVTKDPEFNKSDLTQTIIIVLLVVLLVLIAVGYLIFTLTSGKIKKNKPTETDRK